jgi:glycosyltransferase involved in cell wall biosynthesis
LLIQAYRQLNTSQKLVLAGGSSYSDAYAAGLRACANDQIHVRDWITGSARDEVIANASLFVLPSDVEGLSVSLLEAMGAGVCVLTSDIPENREVVEGAGFTFKRGDVEDLTRMLRLLLQDSQVRNAAARRGQQRIRERYLWCVVAEGVDRVYQKVMASPTGKHVAAREAA